MIVVKSFKNIFNIPELRRKILFTLGVLIVFRLGTILPIVGVNIKLLAEYMKQATNLGSLFKYLDTFSGSNFERCTLFSLGISPNITASIMMQLLGMSVPSFERLLKEGEFGRKIFNQYTRYLTLVLSVFYSVSYATFLESQNLVLTPGWGFRAMFILSMVTGSMFVMWLGEQISIYGIGNGASMIIFAGIVARFPIYVSNTINYVDWGKISLFTALFIVVFFLIVIACIVYLEKGERKIPVQYARRMVGNRMYAGQSSYIPFKINAVGVMPVIFASSMLQIPMYIVGMLSSKFPVLKALPDYFLPTGIMYNAMVFVLIMFFTFFYTALIFDPEKLSQDMKKGGGFIPGIRPGRRTEQFFDYILTRLGLLGALYLGVLAIIPNALMIMIPAMPFYLGGTALLIVVGVASESAAQIESYLIEHRYEGFLSTGRIKGRQ